MASQGRVSRPRQHGSERRPSSQESGGVLSLDSCFVCLWSGTPDFLPATGLMGRVHGRSMSYHLQIARAVKIYAHARARERREFYRYPCAHGWRLRDGLLLHACFQLPRASYRLMIVRMYVCMSVCSVSMYVCMYLYMYVCTCVFDQQNLSRTSVNVRKAT